MMLVDCLLHVHSSFSYDSETDLSTIARIARAHGIRFVLMSEHNNFMNAREMEAFVARCDELSDRQVRLVPGLELAFEANRVHLLAYGIQEFIPSLDIECSFLSLVARVRQLGGAAVLAHPYHRDAIECLTEPDLQALDGIEVWNVKSGNRFVPGGRELRLLKRLRARSSHLRAFGGLDWHHENRFSWLVSRVRVDAADTSSVLHALRTGDFEVRGTMSSVPSDGGVGSLKTASYSAFAGGLASSRRVAYRWQARLESRGFKTPGVLSALAKRFF